MDKKLTDAEIVKACKDCLHYEACKGTYSSAKGDEDILYDFDGEMYANSGCEDFEDKDLINRLQAEIEQYKDYNSKWIEKCEELKAEVFAKEQECIDMQEQRDSVEYNLELLKQEKSVVKAEAYKEFAELIKKDFENPYIQKLGLDFVDFLKGVVDNRLKRTVGEDK
jgi:hypothetical protein